MFVNTMKRFITILVLVVNNIDCSRFALYTKTSIIKNSCDKSTRIDQGKVKNRVDCARFCTENSECRRYVFCPSNSLCKLYFDGKDCIMAGISIGCSCYRKKIGCDGTGVCTCPLGYHGNQCEYVVKDCSDARQKGITFKKPVLAYIKPTGAAKPFEVSCQLKNDGWTTILDRFSKCDMDNFNVTLDQYKVGFGQVPWNMWLGFDKILQIMANPNTERLLNVYLVLANGTHCQTTYRNFEMGNGSSNYQIYASAPNSINEVANCLDGIMGDIDLTGNKFSTYDLDFTGNSECSQRYGGGWWFEASNDCSRSFLTGTMDNTDTGNFWVPASNGKGYHRARLRIKVV